MKISAKILGIAALGLTALASAHPLYAQAAAADAIVLPTTGTKEIGLAGNYHFNTPKFYNLQGLYGVFVTPEIEFGGQLGVSGADGVSTTTIAGAFADYYFSGSGGSSVLPYIGITGGYAHSSGNDGSSIGGQAGIKYFLNSSVAVTAAFQYTGTRNVSGQSDFILGLSTFIK